MRPRPMNPTFMVLLPSRSDELAADPFDLALYVFDDVAGLQIVRQHVPGIGLDLELRRELVVLVEAQRVLDREARGPELAEVVEEHRHVHVRAPLARTRIVVPRRERV